MRQQQLKLKKKTLFVFKPVTLDTLHIKSDPTTTTTTTSSTVATAIH